MVEPYYSDEWVTILHGDCRELLPTLPKVDLVLTDPPYGVAIGPAKDGRGGRHGLAKVQPYACYDDTLENFISLIVPRISDALLLASRGAIFAGPHFQLLPKASALGGIFCSAGSGRHCWGFNTFSPILFYGQAPELHKRAYGVVLSSNATADDNGHPCPKPLTWIQWLVGIASVKSENVIDPFMGSGTTLVAAKQLQRHAIGIEIEERYCEIAARRCEAVQPSLFDAPAVPLFEPQAAFFGEDA